MYSETVASSLRHYKAVLTADVLHHYHVASHVEHLVILYVDDIPRFAVPLRFMDLFHQHVTLRPVPHGLSAEDHIISEDGQDHIGVVDGVRAGVH